MRDSDEEKCPVLFRCRHHLWGDLTKFCWSFKSIYSSVSRSTDLFLHLSFLALPPVLFIRLSSTSNLLNTCCLLLLLAFPSTIFSTLNFFHSTSFVSLSLLHFSLSLPLCFRVPRCICPTYRSSSLSFPMSFHPQSTSITTLPSSFSYFTPSFDSHFNSFVFLFLSFYSSPIPFWLSR